MVSSLCPMPAPKHSQDLRLPMPHPPMNDARYAYHEAGHAVAAAVLGFSFRSSGIHVDPNGIGVTQIVCPSKRCSAPFTTLRINQARMIVVLLTGLVAQK